MTVFTHPDFKGHEGVFFHHDPKTGLRCIVSIHSTKRGPATGGCRMWNYKHEDDALKDVLRLSRGMSFKNAVSDLALGGGKSVILGNPKTDKSEELFRAFGRFINSLGGRYITAEDVGISPADMEIVAQETRFVAGLEKTGIAPSGDPSPFTAYGVFEGLKGMVQYKLGRDLNGVRVAVQGLGHVGMRLCKHLHEAGAVLIVTDIDEQSIATARDQFGAEVVAPDAIYDVDAEVFSPCALGSTVNEETVPRLKAKVIAGAANNQLSDRPIGDMLLERDIVYAPDYVINCGGIINVEGEIYGHYDAEDSRRKIRATIDRLVEIARQSEERRVPANIIANEMAERMLNEAPSVPPVIPGAPASKDTAGVTRH